MNLDKITTEHLVEIYDNLRYKEEELVSEKKVLADEILNRLKNDAEIIGNYTVTKVKRYKFDMPIEKARELGIAKMEEKIDQKEAKNLYMKGVDIPVTITYYPLVKLQEVE